MSNSRIAQALEVRNKRKQSEEEARRVEKENSDSRLNAALSARRERILSSLPATFSEVETRLSTEIDHYNNTRPAYGAYEETVTGQRERRIGINNLRNQVNAYRSYMNDETAESISSILDQMEHGYDSYLTLSSYESEEEFHKAEERQKQYDDTWGHYADADDFAYYSAKGAAIKNPTMDAAESDGRFLWWQWEGDKIGNVVTYSRENADMLATAYGNGENTKGNHKYRRTICQYGNC